jgi:transposase InsO family protein
MPWGVKTVEDIRQEFVLAALAADNFSEVCREFGITRTTGYKWLKRAGNKEPLIDQSRRPNLIANKTAEETELLILAVRQENPAWGGKTIRSVLKRQGYEGLPCVKTCNNILKRNGCIDETESLKHKAFIRFQREHANELWQTDFKGDFLMNNGKRCYPLTILDDSTRYSIMVDAKEEARGVQDSFRRAFQFYGMPEAILSDNGAQFRGFCGGYTQFERWLMDHDILPIHGRVNHPQTQGKIERFHRTMKQELLQYVIFDDIEAADLRLQEWRTKYNEIRPHEAIGMLCPADVYSPSKRTYNENVKQYEYCGLYKVRKVNNWGYLRFDNFKVYLSETMGDTYLETRANPHGDSLHVFYRNFKIAEIDLNTGKLLNRKVSRG